MKKPVYILILQVFFALSSYAQQTSLLLVEPQVCPQAGFQIPLIAHNLQNAGALTFFLTFDTTQFTFDSVANIHPSFSKIKHHVISQSTSQNTLAFSWYYIYGVSADTLVLMNLCFSHKSGTSNLVFDAGCELRDKEQNMTSSELVDAVINPAIAIQSQASDTTVNFPGEAVFTIEATGSETFQWLRSADKGLTYAEMQNSEWIQGVNSDTLRLHHPGAHYDSNLFVCMLSTASCEFRSPPALLQVILPPPDSFSVQLSAGWNGFSSYLYPKHFAIDSIFSPIKSSIIYMTDGEGIYYPMGNISSLSAFNSTSAYLIKTLEAESFIFDGYEMMNRNIQLSEGWNLFPFLCEQTILVQDMESDFLEHLLVIKDASGINVYWPEKNITSLQILEPGKAYQVKMDAPTEIQFSNCGK